MTKRIGILTGGGDCPGLNAVIRGVVKASLVRGWEVIGIEDGFDGFLHPQKCRALGLEDVSGILPQGGTILGTSNRGNPFRYPILRQGKVELVDVSDEVVSVISALGLDGLIVVGGDGTLKIALELMNRGVPIVGVPKTIDNDLLETDVTFGYNTACEVATEALDRLHSTAQSHHRVMVLEVMGRYAGWIALESGIAGGADVILVPEIPYDIEKVSSAIVARSKRGKRFSVVIVAEGAYPKGGNRVVKEAAGGKVAVERLGGIGEMVSRELGGYLETDIRATVLGHLQRGGSPSMFDRCLGSRFGVKAVELIQEGSFGRMVALRGRRIESAWIGDAVRHLNLIDPEGEMVRHAEELGIILGR
ncbi:6-phosphofructokinase [Geomesophilobacter sediminis]|uniref:ATP-dependent 6-phosphofructokinase n=1 Tax=Geomesophilobacter sediminis TaxID=2798584 RepID=A0A8J7JB02_9BACT|nr:6-phosphofructokinase [Geomesophilobacter sediminis]MBJ6724206.1 6-phosphofructokinase [Geomesophilobacter sediminis]